jgi:NTP pyrophosphatase (non-canonical NTP hydrolase)
MNKEKIHAEALKRVGNGQKGRCFELGAEWALGEIPRINNLAQTAFDTAIIRGKTARDMNHLDTFFGILSELKEFREASEIDPSEHLSEYTQAQEELTDVLICCLTELHRRGVDVERIIKEKIEFNKTRCNR